MKNCVEIVQPFVAAADQLGIDFQVMGGVGTRALEHPDTVMDAEARVVIAPADLFLGQFRDDEQKNRRDLDVLVRSADEAKVMYAETVGRSFVGDALETSFFGLRPMAVLEHQVEHPRRSTLERWVGDRYVEVEGDGETEVVVAAKKALFPLATEMDLNLLGGWRLLIGENDPTPTPIQDPRAMILNYHTRSIAGLRPKDADKLGVLSNNVFAQVPGAKEYLMDGPGRTTIELARLISSLRHTGNIAIGDLIIPGYKGDIRDHEAFMIPDADATVQDLVVRDARAKAKVDFFFESHPAFVNFWQRRIMPHLGRIINND